MTLFCPHVPNNCAGFSSFVFWNQFASTWSTLLPYSWFCFTQPPNINRYRCHRRATSCVVSFHPDRLPSAAEEYCQFEEYQLSLGGRNPLPCNLKMSHLPASHRNLICTEYWMVNWKKQPTSDEEFSSGRSNTDSPALSISRSILDNMSKALWWFSFLEDVCVRHHENATARCDSIPHTLYTDCIELQCD